VFRQRFFSTHSFSPRPPLESGLVVTARLHDGPAMIVSHPSIIRIAE